MKLTPNLGVSAEKLAELQAMKPADQKKWIKAQNIYPGHSVKFIEAKEKEVYEKINARRNKKEASKADSGKTGTGDSGDNPKGPEDSGKKKG